MPQWAIVRVSEREREEFFAGFGRTFMAVLRKRCPGDVCKAFGAGADFVTAASHRSFPHYQERYLPFCKTVSDA